MDINEFYKNNEVHEDFDHLYYVERYEKVANFYQPYCSENNISDRKRLYYHYMFHGKELGFQPHALKRIKQYEEYNQDILNEPITVVVGCKDREKMLNISLRSWLLHDQIKEIIIVDWSCANPIKHFENIDPRIRVIRVEGQLFYNASKPINAAIKEAKYEKILKMDVDYILNPYFPLASLVDISPGEFVAGNWRQSHYDNNLGFIQNLNGIICCHKDLFIKAGMYNEDIDNYGREDCEMFERIEAVGGKRKDIEFAKGHVPVYHNPHNIEARGINRKDADVISTNKYFQRKFGTKNFELIINLYRDNDEARRNEILDCLKVNLENKYIDHVHIFLENWQDFPEFYDIPQDNITTINVDERVSFRKIFDYCNENIVNKQCIVANNDIMFTDDLRKIRGIQPKEFFAITRHENGKLCQNENRDAFCSHDAWIFTSPMVDDFKQLDDSIIIGNLFCDTVLCYLLNSIGIYEAWNPCLDVKIHHMHNATSHASKTCNFDKKEMATAIGNYCNKFGDDDFLHLLVATDIEDYYRNEKPNYFISWYDFEKNDYKY